VIPAVVSYQSELAELILRKKSVGTEVSTYLDETLLGRISILSESLGRKLEYLTEQVIKVREISDHLELAKAYREKVFIAMSDLRSTVDELETLVAKKHWTIPTYAEILNSVN